MMSVLRTVGIDALVAFEGRQYSVPFRHVGERVEVRGCAGTVQILKDCRIVATHPRGTSERLVIDPGHYEGPNTTARDRAAAAGADGGEDDGAGDSLGGSSLDRHLCRACGGRAMNAPRPKLDIDATRERLWPLAAAMRPSSWTIC